MEVDFALAAMFDQRMFGKDFVGGFGGSTVGQSVADEDRMIATFFCRFDGHSFVMSPVGFVAEHALPPGFFVRFQSVGQNFQVRKFFAANEQVNQLMKACA